MRLLHEPHFYRLIYPPGGNSGPAFHGFPSPFCSLIRVADGARIRDLILIRHLRCDERERVAADVDIRDRLLDLRHMT